MALTLPHLNEIERLSPRVVRILGGNPGKFTLQGTNTYLIGTGPKRILLDTGEGNRIWPETLKKALEQEKAEVERVLLSHWHPDHVGGVRDVLTLSPSATGEVKVFKNRPDPGQENISDGQIFETQGAKLRAFHSPGHTVDHMAFILEEENAMFTADNVLGHGTAVFEDLATYLKSLEAMEQQFQGRAYPGHGDVIEDGRAKIGEYISHRREREEQILGVLRDSGGKEGGEAEAEEGWSSMGIVKVVYKEYPENLWAAAEGGVVQVLRKLEGEGRVRQVAGGRWGLGESRSAL
jgi:endoribonuclease LACTB2